MFLISHGIFDIFLTRSKTDLRACVKNENSTQNIKLSSSENVTRVEFWSRWIVTRFQVFLFNLERRNVRQKAIWWKPTVKQEIQRMNYPSRGKGKETVMQGQNRFTSSPNTEYTFDNESKLVQEFLHVFRIDMQKQKSRYVKVSPTCTFMEKWMKSASEYQPPK